MSSNKNKASSDLKPRNQSSPFGKLTNTEHSTRYNPKYFPGQQDILNTAGQNEADILKGALPQQTQTYQNSLGSLNDFTSGLTPDHLVNQQIYDAMYGNLSNPLLRQYGLDVNSLNNELSSKNLLGGSYDALAHGQLNGNLGYNLGQAANNAVLSGLQGTTDYSNMLGNNAQVQGQGLQQLGNLASNYQTLHTALEQELMDPFKAYTQYQQTVNPLQLQQAQYDYSTPTGFQNVMGSIGGGLNAIIPGAGAMYTSLGNAFGNPGAASQYSYGGTGNNTLSALGSLLGGGGGAQVLGSGSSGSTARGVGLGSVASYV